MFFSCFLPNNKADIVSTKFKEHPSLIDYINFLMFLSMYLVWMYLEIFWGHILDRWSRPLPRKLLHTLPLQAALSPEKSTE